MSSMENTKNESKANNNALLLGTGLALASLILLPAVATRMGLGSSLTGALRIALMKASYRAGGSSAEEGSTPPAGFSCH